MNTTELLAVFRQEVFDTELPYLWSDDLVYGYIDDAQKQFCRDTFGIEDSRSYTIKATIGNEWYAIDPKILRILGITEPVNGDDVPVLSIDQTIADGIRFNGKTGVIQAFINGMQKNYLRAYPIPNAAGTFPIRTLRLPEDVVSGDDFEIDDIHVRNLLLWVKFRAYSVQDAETADKTKAQAFRDEFMAYCLKSKTEQGRLRRQIAVVSYGGI